MAPALSALACQQSLLFLLFPDMQENVSVDDRVAICSEFQGNPEMAHALWRTGHRECCSGLAVGLRAAACSAA